MQLVNDLAYLLPLLGVVHAAPNTIVDRQTAIIGNAFFYSNFGCQDTPTGSYAIQDARNTCQRVDNLGFSTISTNITGLALPSGWKLRAYNDIGGNFVDITANGCYTAGTSPPGQPQKHIQYLRLIPATGTDPSPCPAPTGQNEVVSNWASAIA